MISLDGTADVVEIGIALISFGIIPIKRRIQKRWMEEFVPIRDAAVMVAAIKKEVTVNGGGSMKDLMNTMADTVGHIQDDLSLNTLMTRSLASSDRRVAIFQRNGAGLQVWASEAWLAMTGLTVADSAGWGWINGIHPEDRERVVDAWNDTVTQKRVFIETFRHYNVRTGVSTEVRCRVEPVLSNSGRPLGWVGAAVPLSTVLE